MKILRKSERILSYAGLGNDPYVRIGAVNIPRIFVRFVYLSALGMCCTLHACLCVKNIVLGPIAILLPVGVIISCVSIILIYISLILKTHEIIGLFDHLQHFFARSTYFFSQMKRLSLNWLIFFFLKEFACHLIRVAFTKHRMHSLTDWLACFIHTRIWWSL